MSALCPVFSRRSKNGQHIAVSTDVRQTINDADLTNTLLYEIDTDYVRLFYGRHHATPLEWWIPYITFHFAGSEFFCLLACPLSTLNAIDERKTLVILPAASV